MVTFFDGQKSIPIDRLPPEAWTVLGGQPQLEGDQAILYEKLDWLYRCVMVRANYLLNVPWAITKQGQDEDEPIWTNDTDPPGDLMWLHNLPDMLWLSEASLSLSGEAFWYKKASPTRMDSIRWLAPQNMIPQWSEAEGLKGYKRLIGSQSVMLDLDEVVYIKLLNPLHETEAGGPPAAAAASAASVLYNVDQFAAGFFQRGAIKATLLTVSGNPKRAEMEKLESWWRRFFKGVATAWETVAIRESITPVQVGEGISEISNTQLSTEQRERISTAMGVPHSLLFSNAANYATARVDERLIYESTVLPDARIIRTAINQQLLAPLGLSLQFAPEQLAVFQEDEKDRSAALLNLANAGIPTITAAAILGYDVPEGMPLEAEQPATPDAAGDFMREMEVKRLQRWARNRADPDPAEFSSRLLTEAEKELIVDLAINSRIDSWTPPVEDSATADAPFPVVPSWDDYG